MKNITKLNSIVLAGILSLVLVPGLTGCAGDRYHESTGEYVDDSSLTVRVKDALSHDNYYKFDDVKVTSFKGTVQLSGWVTSSDQKGRAADIAKGIEGVKSVENNISIRS